MKTNMYIYAGTVLSLVVYSRGHDVTLSTTFISVLGIVRNTHEIFLLFLCFELCMQKRTGDSITERLRYNSICI